ALQAKSRPADGQPTPGRRRTVRFPPRAGLLPASPRELQRSPAKWKLGTDVWKIVSQDDALGMNAMSRFSIRDLLWLTLVVAMGLGWFVRERQLLAEKSVSIRLWRGRTGALERALETDGWRLTWRTREPQVSMQHQLAKHNFPVFSTTEYKPSVQAKYQPPTQVAPATRFCICEASPPAATVHGTWILASHEEVRHAGQGCSRAMGLAIAS